jgi:hypothetical protein
MSGRPVHHDQPVQSHIFITWPPNRYFHCIWAELKIEIEFRFIFLFSFFNYIFQKNSVDYQFFFILILTPITFSQVLKERMNHEGTF